MGIGEWLKQGMGGARVRGGRRPVASAPVLRSVDLGRLLNIDEPREAKPPGHL